MTVNKVESRRSSQVPIENAADIVSPSLKLPRPSEAKVNGRLAISLESQVEQLSVVAEESSTTLAESPGNVIVKAQKTSGGLRLLAEQQQQQQQQQQENHRGDPEARGADTSLQEL
jgi:hypothetical protein